MCRGSLVSVCMTVFLSYVAFVCVFHYLMQPRRHAHWATSFRILYISICPLSLKSQENLSSVRESLAALELEGLNEEDHPDIMGIHWLVTQSKYWENRRLWSDNMPARHLCLRYPDPISMLSISLSHLCLSFCFSPPPLSLSFLFVYLTL